MTADQTPVIQAHELGIRFLRYRRQRLSLREMLVKGESTSPRGAFWALRGVSFDVHEGEAVGLVGANGQGKSTLLKLIAGLEELSDGEIYVGGRLANYLKPSDRDVAMAFQNYALYPHMTVAANMAISMK